MSSSYHELDRVSTQTPEPLDERYTGALTAPIAEMEGESTGFIEPRALSGFFDRYRGSFRSVDCIVT
jgi:hypothetical protein